MARLGWLHLSDLHLGVHGSRLLRPEYKNALERDLRELHSRAGPWNLVLVSGGLTLTGSPQEFELLSSAFGSLWTLLRSLGSDPCLLVVPGDRDIRRASEPRLPDLGHRYRALDARKALRTPGSGKVARELWKGFAPFSDWFATWRHAHPASSLRSFRHGLLPGDFAAEVTSDGISVGVVGLNSNFRSSARDGATGMREIDVEQLETAVGQELRAWARPHDAILLLTHHPPSMLREELLGELGNRLAIPGRPLLHVCGNRQEKGDSLLGVPPRPWSRSLHASDLFSEPLNSARTLASGYFAGRLDLSGTRGRLEIFPRSAISGNDLTVVLGPDTRALPADRDSLDIPWTELLREPEVPAPPMRVESPPTSAASLKMPNQESSRLAPTSSDTHIRILHLSDLHVEGKHDPYDLFQPLEEDLRNKRLGMGIDQLDYLVISGDITQKATRQEFETAREFVSLIVQRFGLTSRQCILVPGNHDLDWSTQVYKSENRPAPSQPDIRSGEIYDEGPTRYVRDGGKYPERFKNFSEYFYEPLIQRPYPLPAQEQCISTFFPESRIQFLALNSSWEIDRYFKERSSIFGSALSRGLMRANEETRQFQEEDILRIAVWHHPISGNEKIKDDAFVSRLSQAHVRVCLHGHVHETRAELFNHTRPDQKMHVIGAGSFGASARERPESEPCLYNLLEVDRALRQIKVNVRRRPKQGGAWEPAAQWRNGRTDEMRAHYHVPLSDERT